jgi:hypothetical protein
LTRIVIVAHWLGGSRFEAMASPRPRRNCGPGTWRRPDQKSTPEAFDPRLDVDFTALRDDHDQAAQAATISAIAIRP